VVACVQMITRQSVVLAGFISRRNTAEAARGSWSAVDRQNLREAAEHGEITVNRTAVIVTGARFRPLTALSQGEGASTADDPESGRRPPLRGSIKNALCMPAPVNVC